MTESAQGNMSTKRLILTVVIYVVVIAAALVGSYFLAQAAVPAPKIGVLYLDMEVSTLLSEIMYRQIDYALNTPDIKGVVLVVNSPGGSASAGQGYLPANTPTAGQKAGGGQRRYWRV